MNAPDATRAPRVRLIAIAALISALAPWSGGAEDLDATFVERFGRLALDCAHREYPNKIAHVLSSDADVLPPRELTPAFYGCYDWHSAVHGHWLLARLARRFPESPMADPARAALARSLTPANLEAEASYLEGEGRVSFERPYGLAWLLQLASELHEWDDPQAREWAEALEPLEQTAAARLREWVPKLSDPIRIGEHSQTAFAFGLIVDWARTVGDRETESIIREASFRFYFDDRDCPIDYEPSGHDFLSPCLAEADLMRRFLWPTSYAAWLGGFLPGIPQDETTEPWIAAAVVTDPEDPKLAHLDGLNLSRAWMLEGMIAGLPVFDPRLPALVATARSHREAGVASVTGEHYEGGHWLGSFATYLVTDRGGSNVLSSGPFDVVYRGVDRQVVERVVLPRAHRALADVTGYLEVPFDGTILIDLSPRHRSPYQHRHVISLPVAPLVEEGDAARGGISLVHEITHVVAPSAYRPDRFYDDGLAVYLQWKFGSAPSYPQYDRDLHAETRAAQAEAGDVLQLSATESTRNTTRVPLLRRLAYLQEGSFTGYLIDRQDLASYLRVYRGDSLEAVYGADLEELEAEWRDWLSRLD